MTPRPRRLVVGAALVVVVGVAAGAVATAGGGLIAWQTPSSSGGSLPAPHYVDDTAGSGVDHTFATLEDIGVGGGVAAFDCDGDRKPDLYVAGGTGAAELYRNASAVGGPLRFEPVGDAVTDISNVVGAYPLDVDGDGIGDLAVLRAGGVQLLRGLGGCRFEAANERWNFDGGDGWVTAFSATWERDGLLPTLAVGNYLRLDAKGPATYACDDDLLVRPAAGAATYAAPTALTPGFCALSMLFSDWDRSGRRDLRVSNDRHYYDFVTGGEQLWRMEPGIAPRAYTAADGWVQMQIWGMGIASADLTGDGYPEVYLTNQGENRLQTLAASPATPSYVDIGLKRGANATFPYARDTTLPSTSWHDQFEDVNDDGHVDLFVAKGSIGQQAAYAIRDPSDLLIGRADGTFVEGAGDAGLLEFDPGRGAALADFNLDGLPDLVEVKLDRPLRVWRNVGAGDGTTPRRLGTWLDVDLTEPGPNRDAIGAWVEVRVGDVVQRREVTVGGGHASGTLGWLHFGLGGAQGADVRVTWPDGAVGAWQTVDANRFELLARDASPQRWTPGS